MTKRGKLTFLRGANMEKISVIVPIHNPPLARFRLCLNSLMNQLGVNYELLLVDDGSTVDVEKIVKKHQNQFKNLEFYHSKKQGVGAARNTGLEMASGDYIVFCDSDDFVENNYLFSLWSALKSADLAICGVTEQFFPVVDSFVDSHVFYSFPSIYNKIQYMNFSVNKIFKKSILDENNIRFDETIALGEDGIFIGEYIKYCKYIRTIANNLYHYLPNPASAIHSYYSNYWQWENRLITLQFEYFTQFPLNSIEEKYMYYWAFYKIRSTVNYYAEHEKNEDKLKKKLVEIEKSQIYTFLMKGCDLKHNIIFNKKEYLLLYTWKKQGLYKGIILKKCASLLKNILCRVA